MISRTIVMGRSSANDPCFFNGSVTHYNVVNPDFTPYQQRMRKEQRLHNRAIKRLRKFLIESFTMRDA